MWGPGETLIIGYPQITSGVDPFDWFYEECNWSGLDYAPSDTRDYNRGALRHINDEFTFTQPPLKDIEIRLQVHDKHRRLARLGYDSCVVPAAG